MAKEAELQQALLKAEKIDSLIAKIKAILADFQSKSFLGKLLALSSLLSMILEEITSFENSTTV